MAGFGRTEGEEKSGLDLGQNAREIPRDNQGEIWLEKFWATVFPPHLSERSNNPAVTTIQSSRARRRD